MGTLVLHRSGGFFSRPVIRKKGYSPIDLKTGCLGVGQNGQPVLR